MSQNEIKAKKQWTILEIINWGTKYLAAKGTESPRLTIELILSKILSSSRIELYLDYEKPLTQAELFELKIALKRITAGEPLQYLLEETQFLNHKIKLTKKVFIPRPETEILVATVFENFKEFQQKPFNIIDIGCGSGAISIALAIFFPHSTITAVDIDPFAIEQTNENAQLLNLHNINCFQLDILRTTPKGKFDIIVSNPPYIPLNEYRVLPVQVLKEPQVALTDGADGLTFYRRFAEIFPTILSSNGSFFLEVGWNQAETVCSIFRAKGFDVETKKDFQKIKRIIYSIRY